MADPAPAAFLVPVAGPPLSKLILRPGKQGMVLGRHQTCTLKLPSEMEAVSRFHAEFRHDGDRWRLTDLASGWGTFLNGVKLTAHVQTPLADGDLIRITPWIFSFGTADTQRGLTPQDDKHSSTVRAVTHAQLPPQRDDLLGLFLEASAAIHSAESEAQLAERMMDVALRGTGLSHAVFLRPLDSDGRVEVIAQRPVPTGGKPASFSRSLLAAAARGQVAELSAGGGDISQSVVQMNVAAAICAPLMLGGAPAAFLYLDSRSDRPNRVASQPLRPHAGALAAALGRLGSLALANLKRIEIERRQMWMDGELRAAAAAQQWIFPSRATTIGPYSCIGECRAGQSIGGDFFDVIDLGNGRLAVALGDVSGKGIPASVLMTATQGFLHATLRASGSPGQAVTALNRYVGPRRPEDRFVTMWVGLFDPAAGELRYVDAGHGYSVMLDADEKFTPLDSGGGPPVGVSDDFEYHTEVIALPHRGKVMTVSDGIVEQFGDVVQADGSTARQKFEMDGVRVALRGTDATDDVARVFSAVRRHAGTDQLADDATALAVSW